MQVQINSLAGLERVMGQDPSFELEIKRSVWNEYVRKHIVEELKGEHGRAITEQLSRSVNEELQSWVNESTLKTIKENPRYQSFITDMARKLIRTEVEKLLEEQLQTIIESQSEQLKRIASEVSMKIVRSKIEEKFKASMNSLEDLLRESLGHKG